MDGGARLREGVRRAVIRKPAAIRDLGSFDRLEKELAPGRCWSPFDRAIGAGAFFAERRGEGPEPGRLPEPAREAA